jgi:hypothetical protein
MSRRASPLACLLAIVAFVFAQLAVAAYACEMGMSYGGSMAAPNGDCCDPQTPAPDAACHEHCQQANKAPERAASFCVAPVAGSLAAALRVEPLIAARPPAFLQSPHLARHTEPPVSIRNCCLRI